MRSYYFNGFPVVQEELFLGFVGREKLRLALGWHFPSFPPLLKSHGPIEQLLNERSPTELARACTFSHAYAISEPELTDLSSLLEVSVLELRTEVPLELVVNTIRRMVRVISPFHLSTVYETCDSVQNLGQILFTQRGKLMGLITKSDIVDLLTVHLPHRAALADFVENRRG